MKRSAMILGGVAAMQLMGCMSGEIDTSTGEEAAPSWEEYRASVPRELDTGFFIVNGDQVIDGEKNLREFYDQVFAPEGALIVHTAGGSDAKWNDTQKLNITYCVSSSSFGTRYNTAVSAMTAAAGAWEAVANVNFVHLTQFDSNCTASQSGVVFDVRQTSDQSYLARAFFPNNGRASRNVLISTSAFGNIPPWTLAGILRHELGHTLGFRHEHTRPEAGGSCFEDNSWRALTPYDSASVMHYPQCNGTQNGDLVITQRDRDGAVALYGAPGGNPPPPPPPPPPGGEVTETVEGTVARNAWSHLGYSDMRPGTTLVVRMTGTGDPDLYVRFGSQPTLTQYACRPYLDGATEECRLTVPTNSNGRGYVSVRGYTAATFTVTATYTAP